MTKIINSGYSNTSGSQPSDRCTSDTYTCDTCTRSSQCRAEDMADSQPTKPIPADTASVGNVQPPIGMTRRQQAKLILINNWNAVIAEDAYPDEMERHVTDSLVCQINGNFDMSAEDMTDELAAILGWTLPLTDDQLNEWRDIVTEAACYWMAGYENSSYNDIKTKYSE